VTVTHEMRPEPQRFSWEETRRAFTDAARWFVQMVPLVGERWNRPALGEWDVRALVGHTSRALLTVEMYLDRPPPLSTWGPPRTTSAPPGLSPLAPKLPRVAGGPGTPWALTRPGPWLRSPTGCFSSSTPATVPRW
jgi:hypothetical protein